MSLNLNIKQVKGNLQRLFDKNLTDLVRGLRNNKDNEVGWRSDERFSHNILPHHQAIF